MFEFIWFVVTCMIAGIIVSSMKLQRDLCRHAKDARKRYDDSVKKMQGLDPEYGKIIDDNFWELTDD